MRPESAMASAGAPAKSAGTWEGRPSGVPGTVPPPSIPLTFLAAAAAGLIGCGIAWIWARGAAALDPTQDPVVAAAHLGMLATLSMGVLGALHQFTPVISQRPLRSARLAWATFACWLGAAWLLPLGIATEHEAVVEAGGGLAAVAISLLVVNLVGSLAARGKGAPLAGLRLALAGFVVTASFGVVYVADRRGNWFDLAGHTVLAHAVVGLFGWLGLTYVAVAEKLWPMFFLAHVPGRRRAGHVAVWAVPAGVVLLSPGLLAGIPPLAAAGAAVLAVGLGAHLASLVAHVRHRRRGTDLHLLFVATSATWLLVGAGLALAGTLTLGVAHEHHLGVDLVAAAVAAFSGWLLETLVGHAHKVVPFVGWSALRARGVDKTASGKPLMFADLYDHPLAAVTYGLVTAAIASLSVGLAAALPVATAIGGGLLVATGVVLGANLSIVPARLAARSRSTGPSGGSPAGSPPAGSPPATERPTTLSLVAVVLASVAVLMAGVAIWTHVSGTATSTPTAAAGPVVPNGDVKTVDVSLGSFYVKPSTITLSYGTRLVLAVTNRGDMNHDLQLEGGTVGTGMLAPGQHRTVDYGVFGRSEQAWCTVPGHKTLGMVLDIVVPGTAASSPGAPSAPDATIDLSATPPAGWHAFDPSLAPAPAAKVHHITLVAEDRELQVAPGVTQDMWTWNGRVPGPILRGHVGDVFDITVENHTDMDHSLDVHAASGPMEGLDMRVVPPGQSRTYRFRADHAGVFLWHCGMSPMLLHVANGMYGAIIIDPPGLDPVAHEYVIVQSELYLGPQGRSGDFTKMLHDQPDAWVFDGYLNQYVYSPVRVRAGERIRIYVVDAGPNDDTSFHVVGAQFDTVFKEGTYLLRRGDAADGASQALALSPGQGGFVELTLPAPGHYLMADHHLDHATLGAAGYLLATAR